jgi:hypothetical protein
MSRRFLQLAFAAALAASVGAGGASSSETPMNADGTLISGVGTSAAADAPAVLVLDLARAARAPEGVLELELTPERISRDESFIVSVTAEVAGGPPQEIASVAFFPPPREGETRRFLVDVSELPDTGQAVLSVRLVPATDAPIEETRLRVEGLGLPE